MTKQVDDVGANFDNQELIPAPDLTGLHPTYRIEFSENRWLCHLGGGFLGPENTGTVGWNWLSESVGWCVLPKLSVGRDYAVRLEVAPFVPFGSELWRVTVFDRDISLCEHVFPVGASGTEVDLPVPKELFLAHSPTGATQKFRLLLRMEHVPEPRLALRLNDMALAHLAFDRKPVLQVREFLIRRELLRPENVLFFQPNFGLIESQTTSSEGSKPRRLSFRFYRLDLFELP